MICFGILMYGLIFFIEIKISLLFEFKLVFVFYIEMVYVKEFVLGDSVSYGVIYIVIEWEWVVMLLIGYVDGLICYYSGFYVLVDGELVLIIGCVCMD